MNRLIFAILCLPAIGFAAELRQETLKAWDTYVAMAKTRASEHAHSPRSLWLDDGSDRLARVRQGEIIIEPASAHSPQNVPHGLIHDWIGATFIPHARVADVLNIVRDYGHYKDFYGPAVMESRCIGQGGPQEFRFSLVLLNQALFSTNALETEYKSSYVRVDERRWYSVTETTRVQEIDDYGQAAQRRLPVDDGHGYIWRLYSVARFEERDGGVYVELEAIALSRDIPLSVRWMVEPIIRHVSRTSLMTSLRQTVAQLSRPVLQAVLSRGAGL